MNPGGVAEILATIGLSLIVAWPAGAYLDQIWNQRPTWLDPFLKPIELGVYRLAGVNARAGQRWFEYAGALLAFNAAGFLVLLAILILHSGPPGQPATATTPDQLFNTAVSFVTNSSWPPVTGPSAVSELAQMAGLVTQNFLSAGTALAVAAALARSFAASRSNVVGNFWTDLVRVTLYFLLPLSIVLCLVLVAFGVPQTLHPEAAAQTLEGARQIISTGPLASQVAIAQMGTNNAGFFQSSAAHPLINPGPISNLIEAATLGIPGFACVFALGRTVRLQAEARGLIAAMTLVTTIAALVVYPPKQGQPLP